MNAVTTTCLPKPFGINVGRVICGRHYTNFAARAFHAHSLWIKLWMSLGWPEENSSHPGGNGVVSGRLLLIAHSHPASCTQVRHSRCARRHHRRPATTRVIHWIHRTYDDYESCYY